MTLFVDTAVLIYASGSDHPLREPCARFMRGIGRGEVNAVTSVEVVQEIIHRFLSIRQPEIGLRLARTTMDTFAPILPVTHALLRRVPDLAARYPTLQARDLVHLATCIHEGIAEIVSTDRGFDQVAEVRRIDPLAFAS